VVLAGLFKNNQLSEPEDGLERRFEMPRGVYDRTKTPEQRAAEKSLGGGKKAPKAAKAPKAVKAAAPKKAPKAAKAAATKIEKGSGEPKAKSSTSLGLLDTTTRFSIVRDNIETLVAAVQGLTVGSLSTSPATQTEEIVVQLNDELTANIGVLSGLRRDVFGLSDSEKASASAEPLDVLEAASAATEEEEAEDAEPEVEAAPTQPVPAVPVQPVARGTIPMPPGFPQT